MLGTEGEQWKPVLITVSRVTWKHAKHNKGEVNFICDISEHWAYFRACRKMRLHDAFALYFLWQQWGVGNYQKASWLCKKLSFWEICSSCLRIKDQMPGVGISFCVWWSDMAMGITKCSEKSMETSRWCLTFHLRAPSFCKPLQGKMPVSSGSSCSLGGMR